MQPNMNYPHMVMNNSIPDENSLAWESCPFVVDKFNQHMQNLPTLAKILHNMQKTLEYSRVKFNKAIQERDEKRKEVEEVELRLADVQRIVQRFTSVNEPVVASDGYTYERKVIQEYLEECKSADTSAYSQQTKEVLTNYLVPNQSLKKLVDILKGITPNEIPPASKFISIPPFRNSSNNSNYNTNVHSNNDNGVNNDKTSKAVHAIELEANLSKKNENKAEQNNTKGDGKGEVSSKKNSLHPCLRVYGLCNFRDDCQFAKYPFDACLNYIKGKCRFAENCKEMHVNLKDVTYINPKAAQNQSQATLNSSPSNNQKDDSKKKQKK